MIDARLPWSSFRGRNCPHTFKKSGQDDWQGRRERERKEVECKAEDDGINFINFHEAGQEKHKQRSFKRSNVPEKGGGIGGWKVLAAINKNQLISFSLSFPLGHSRHHLYAMRVILLIMFKELKV